MWEAVHYIVGTIHQDGFRRVFRPYRFASREEDNAAVRAQGQALAAAGFDWIESRLQGQDWLARDYSLADFALFYVSWWNIVRCGFPTPAGVAAHYARMRARPGPAKALADEGLSG
jgi:glutathione S-transferase